MKRIFLVLIIFCITFITFSQDKAGDVWIDPAIQEVNANESFQFNIRVNTGSYVVAAYGINILYDYNLFSVDTEVGYDGVEEGLDGFITSINPNEPGSLHINGIKGVVRPMTGLHKKTHQ